MEPKRLALVRHAKSSWADPALADHDRPLNARGRRAAALVGEHLRAEGVEPDLVLCSSATRARQTLDLFALAPATDIVIEDQLYGAAAHELLVRVRRIPARVGSAMVIGHNPGIEELMGDLVGDRETVPDKFPTGAVADLRLSIPSWPDLDAGTGHLHAFLIPRNLPNR
jgi:phosphohistidine phosphatase